MIELRMHPYTPWGGVPCRRRVQERDAEMVPELDCGLRPGLSVFFAIHHKVEGNCTSSNIEHFLSQILFV